MMILSSSFFLPFLLLLACLALPDALAQEAAPLQPPAPNREFRGVWVASVANIDWPSRRDLTTQQQKEELIRLFDRARDLGLNAVVFQVRPAADALYASPHEPWSEYLTGQMGKAPEPFYDPLHFAVQEAHRRGLELHAWFNPYRARHASAQSEISADHISRTRPHLVRTYGKSLWLDPGEREVQDHSLRVILDVVRRYDIDGAHIDDYFYPYKERDAKGQIIEFPDDPSWRAYQQSGGALSRDDWRRENVNTFIRRLYAGIKAEKPWVKFGVSPFGIWRPGFPGQIRGFDAYEQLYADARKWLVNGWLDYFSPQLYWKIETTGQSYPVLLNWWAEQNPMGRHLWPGNYTSRVGFAGSPVWPPEEILYQIKVTRGHAGATGNVHFSAKSFLREPNALSRMLGEDAYAEPALIPASPWLGRTLPKPPTGLNVTRDPGRPTLTLTWRRGGEARPRLWVVQYRAGKEWKTVLLPGDRTSHVLREEPQLSIDAVAVTAVDRIGNTGPPVAVTVS